MTTNSKPVSTAPQSFRFWGSVMVAVCFIVGVVVYGAGRYSFGVFMKPLADTMSWSRTEISLAATIHLLVYAISSPFIGILFDRIGIRKVMLAGGFMLAFSLCAMFFTASLAGLYFFYGVLAAVGSNAIGRMSQATIISNWFIDRRGLMLGISALSIGLGTAIMAPLVRGLLDEFGWQWAFVSIGLIVLVFVCLPILLLIKGNGRPEERGFGPDGAPLLKVKRAEAEPRTDNTEAASSDWPLAAALRTRLFWVISISMGLAFMGEYVVLLHGPAAIEDRGYSGTTAAYILSLINVAASVGRIVFGWLADNASIRLGFALMFGIELVALPLLIVKESIVYLYVFAVIWGFGLSASSIYSPYILSRLYGRSAFSSIYGWSTMIAALGGALGGLIGGLIYDNTGDYLWAWYMCAALWFFCIVLTQLTLSDKALADISRGPPSRAISQGM